MMKAVFAAFVALGIGGAALPATALAADAPSAHGSVHGVEQVTLVDAVRTEKRDVALALLEKGADPDAATADGTTPLHWAVHNGDADLVKRLIQAGADVNVVNDYGATPMLEASILSDAEIIGALLDAGADPNGANAAGQTPLMYAVRTDKVDAAKRLIDAGADVKAREHQRQQTPLMMAAAERQPEMVQLLIDNGAEVNAHSQINDWERLTTAEPRVQNKPAGGFTALLYAARSGCAACAANLVADGAEVDRANPEGISPLLMATLNARWDTAKVLIERGADVNKWDDWGRAPLYSTVDYSTVPRGGRADRPSMDETSPYQIMSMLLEAGANPDMQLKRFPPYRSLGADRGGDSLLTVGSTPLLRAAKGVDIKAVNILLEHGAMADLPQVRGVTPLMAAAGVGFSIVDTRGRFRLESDAVETIQLLLDAGADLNRADYRGWTALHGAAILGWTDVVTFLAENGANLMATTDDGFDAYQVAMGEAGGLGRFGSGEEVHEETAQAIQDLMSTQEAKLD